MKTILMATGNKGKILEASEILQRPLKVVNVELEEIQSMDLELVSEKKTEEAFRILKEPVITDDVGVFIEALGGFPGPFAKFMLETMGNKRLLELLENETNRKVIVKSVIGYHDGKKVHTFVGEVKGVLATKERGSQGWGFDPIIIPNGFSQTYAEMGPSGKNKISHRKIALDKLHDYLNSKNK